MSISTSMSRCTSVYNYSISMSVYLCVCLSVCLSVCLFLSVYLSISASSPGLYALCGRTELPARGLQPSVIAKFPISLTGGVTFDYRRGRLGTRLYLSTYLSVYLSVCLSIYLSVCLSIFYLSISRLFFSNA